MLETELEFGRQFELWFEELRDQVESVAEIHPPEELQTAWIELQERAENLLEWCSEEDWDPEEEIFQEEYSGFVREAESFADLFSTCSSPDAWLLEPLDLVNDYLESGELSSRCGRLLQGAFEEVYDHLKAPALEDALRTLMTWAQGHKQMSLFEVREALQQARDAAANLPELSPVGPPSVLEMLSELHENPQEDTKQLLGQAISDWEEELAGLLGSLGDNEVDFSDELNELFESCSEVLERLENDPLGVPPEEFEALCETWQRKSPQLELFSEMAARRLNRRRPILDELERAAGDFQSGRLHLSQWRDELDEHQTRWNSLKDGLHRALADKHSQRLLEKISASLQTMMAVERPDDSRLPVALSSYIETLKTLEERERETMNG